METINAIASELSYYVMLKRQQEQNGKDVPKVQAPAEKPSQFVRDERMHTGVNTFKALR